MMKRILEFYFGIQIFIGLMKLADFMINSFIQEIPIQNILAVVCVFLALIISAGLSEWIVKKIKEYL